MRSLCSTLVLVALLPTPAVRGDGPPVPPLTDAVRDAVAARKVEDISDMGDRAGRAVFRDVAADGAVLVGLEVGLARAGEAEIPYAMRPVFRRGQREWTGATAGNMAAKEVRRTVRVVARPEYAVGGMWVRSGGAIDRICLVFVRVRDGGLDPADSDTSSWVGTSDGGNDRYIDGRGQPMVGLFADTPQGQVRNLGIVCVQIPPVKRSAARDPAKAADPAERPNAAEAGPRKPALAEEAAPPVEEEEGNTALILLAVSAVIGIPAGLFGLVALTQKSRVPPVKKDQQRRPRPKSPAPELSPRPTEPAAPAAAPVTTAAAERPELARRLQPYLPASPVAPALADPGRPADHPPFFTVRATYRSRFERMTRVYVAAGELLVIDAGPGSDVNQVAGFTAATLSGGGVIGALVGGAVGTMAADSAKAKGEALQLRLNRLDLAGVLAWADQGGNCRVRLEDLVGVCIDPPGVKGRSRGVGTFRFRDVKRGEFTFEFLSGAEIWVAVELLRRKIGPALHVGTGWDEATAVYLGAAAS
jgi:hypothetical protein